MRDVLTASENWSRAAHYAKTTAGHPTYEHLKKVVDFLAQFTTDDEILAAGWMHDTLKYTNTTREEIGKTLSRRIAQLVWLVTDPEGVDRADRKARLYAKILAEPNVFYRTDAAFLKCADRIVNMRDALNENDTKRMLMYVAEHPDFMRVFAVDLLRDPTRRPLWDWLFQLYGQIHTRLSNGAVTG